jgi:hypothetical protein
MLRSDVLVFAALWIFFLAAYSVCMALIMDPAAGRTSGYAEQDNAAATYAKLMCVDPSPPPPPHTHTHPSSLPS